MRQGMADLMWKLWYPLLTRLTRRAPVVFLNYGYADHTGPSLTLNPQDEADRQCIALYDRVIRPVNLAGLRVLEVSCGHGGGASYVARYAKPLAMRGIDRNGRAIDLCRRRHHVEGLSFARGDALAIDAADASLDAVINVEASHCYPDAARFFREVVRVLRPGGSLLYADFRSRAASDVLQRQFEASGLEILEREDISRQVVRGMTLNTPKYLRLIDTLVPRALRKAAMRFAGVEGSAIYRELISGETIYWRYALRKPVDGKRHRLNDFLAVPPW